MRLKQGRIGHGTWCHLSRILLLLNHSRRVGHALDKATHWLVATHRLVLLLRIHRPEGLTRHHGVVIEFRLVLMERLLVSIVVLVVAVVMVVVGVLSKATAKVSGAYLAENLSDHTYHLVDATIRTRDADRSIKEVSLFLGVVLPLVYCLFH